MCCPKGKCGCQYFILLTLKKIYFMDTGVLDFFNKKIILDYYFCLMSGPHGKKMYVKEIYVIFIHLFDSGILLIIDLNKKKPTWFCLSYFLKTNIKCYCIYQYFMSINSFFNTVSVSRYSRPITVTLQWPVTQISASCGKFNGEIYPISM
jgi:hypothetical protein